MERNDEEEEEDVICNVAVVSGREAEEAFGTDSDSDEPEAEFYSESIDFVDDELFLRLHGDDYYVHQPNDEDLSPTYAQPHKSYNSLNELLHKFSSRREQIDLILRLIGQDYAAPHLFVYGQPGTGKTVVLREIFNYLGKRRAYINCVGCYSPRILFETIVNQLHGHVPSPETEFKGFMKCEHLAELVDLLNSDAVCTDSRIYLILDRAERLRTMGATLLPGLLRLKEFVNKRDVCVILVSNLPWEKYRDGTGVTEPIPIHFPMYTKEETISIIQCEDCPAEEDMEFFYNYVRYIYEIFSSFSRNITELRYVVSALWPIYTEPIRKKQLTRDNVAALAQRISPFINKGLLHKLYLRELTQEQLSSLASLEASSTSNKLSFELPRNTKFLLIASYLASHNPAKADVRMFSHRSTGVSRQPAVSKLSKQQGAAKMFSLERMLAIFESITGQPKENHTASLYAAVSSLVSLKLLVRVSTPGTLDNVKLKCNADEEFIAELAKSVQLDLSRYIVDN